MTANLNKTMTDNLELPMCLLDWIDKDNLNWDYLSQNINAIQLLRENPDKISWIRLTQNSSLDAIQLLKENPLQIHWTHLSLNPNAEAIQMLRENPLQIDWTQLSSNPSIFTYDYEKMRENMLLFKEDLMKERFHPRNLRKFSSWGFGGIDEDDEE